MPRRPRSEASPPILDRNEAPEIRLLHGLRRLDRLTVPRRTVTPAPAVEIPACQPPSTRVPPEWTTRYVRYVQRPLQPVRPPGLETPPPGDGVTAVWRPLLTLACVRTTVEANLAVALTFEQTLRLQGVFIGDLASTMGLAPSEQLTLEFFSSQRRLLDRLTVDSTEEITTRENTTLDKEVMNVAHSSSQTEKWGVNGNGSFSLGFVKLGAGADISSTTTNTAQDSMQHISEATEKSARTLKSLHKVEVRTVTETVQQNRILRVIRNPYPDRTLALNVFELVKRFSVETRLAEVRPALVIALTDLRFDRKFVLTQAAFLREALLDKDLLERLDALSIGFDTTGGGEPAEKASATAVAAARQALRYLFEVRNIFNLRRILLIGSGGGSRINPNAPESSFNDQASPNPDKSAFGDSQNKNLIVMLAVVTMYFRVYREALGDGTVDAQALALARSLATAIKPRFDALSTTPDDVLIAAMDNESLTEVYCRLPGFLAMVTGIVEPLAAAAETARGAEQIRGQAAGVIDMVVEHLNCNRLYYTQKLIEYLARVTENRAIVEFVEQVIESHGAPFAGLAQLVDAARAYLEGSVIVVPGFRTLGDDPLKYLASLDGKDVSDQDYGPVVTEIEVACDGVHLEVAPGLCVLEGLPNAAAQPAPVP